MWLLKNPFSDYVTENINPKNLVSLFQQPDKYDDLLVSDKHIFIEGPRGSGKSMLLRYLDYYSQIQVVNNDPTRLGFIGLYLKISDAPPLGDIFKDAEKAAIFTDYLNLSLIQIQLAVISDILTKLNKEKGIEQEIIAAISETLMDDEIKKSEKLLEVTMSIQNKINYISKYVQERIFSRKEYKGVFSDTRLLAKLFKLINSKIIELNSKKYFVLIDEYDDLGIVQQKVINQIIKSRPNEILLLKIGSARFGIKTKECANGNTIQMTHDYEMFDTDFEVYEGKGANYKLIQEISNTRLKNAGITSTSIEELFPEHNIDEKYILEATKELETEFHSYQILNLKARKTDYLNKKKVARVYQLIKNEKKKRKDLSGFSNLVNISSGNIREFLMLCELAFNLAIKNEEDVTKGVSAESQNSAIYEMSRRFFAELSTHPGGNEVSKIIQHLVEVSYKKLYDPGSKDPEMIKYHIVDENELKNVLDTAYKLNALAIKYSYPKNQKPRVKYFILNRMLCPNFDLSPTVRWRSNISEEELLAVKEKEIIHVMPENFRKSLHIDTSLSDYIGGTPPNASTLINFDMDTLPGNKNERIFLGGNYNVGIGNLKEIKRIIKRIPNSGYHPIIVEELNIDKNQTNEISIAILHHCGKVIFEMTTPSDGAAMEIESLKRLDEKDYDAYIIYSGMYPSPMITSAQHIKVKKKYSDHEKLVQLINEIIQCMDGKIPKHDLNERKYDD